MSSDKKKYGIMGGTFDPIHIGHLFIAEEIRQEFNLDRIIFIPTGNPPHKDNKGITDAFDRYIMTILATNNNPYFYVSDIEVKREGISYTYDTLKILKEKYKNTDFYFITGADAIIELPTWNNINKLVKMCKFIAATRPGFDFSKLKREISNLEHKYGIEILTVNLLGLQISSTEIRKRIKQNRPINYFITDSVKGYIDKKDLYI